MDILFVGGLYPKELIIQIQKNIKDGNIQNAPNVFQWAIIDGLIGNDAIFNVITIPSIPCFPIKYRKSNIEKTFFNICEKSIGICLGFSTMIFIKPISIYFNLRRKIVAWIKIHINQKDLYILIYGTNPEIMMAAYYAKKMYPSVKICVIITDLVDNALQYKINKSFLKRIQVSIDYFLVKRMYSKMDCFVLLSEYMKEKIPVNNLRYCVVEGLFSTYSDFESSKLNNEKVILYSGTLQRFSCVDLLIDAFMSIPNKSFRLIICGVGHFTGYIQKAAAIDNRIVYKGLINRESVLSLQKHATLLVNPRQPDGQITKYSFPSKTMEYMASGIPVLMYKLEGIPDEYFNYCFTLNDLSVESLALKIEEILSMDEDTLTTKGKAAKKYILENKNPIKQVAQILTLLKNPRNETIV